MAIDITKGIEPFEDRMDVTRNNPDRKPFGRSGNDGLDITDEYAQPKPPANQPPPPVEPEKKEPVAAKFTHKLANGTVLEAATMEEMAALIEKAVTQQTPATLDFEDKPLYQPYEFKRKDLTLQEQAEILNLWKENPQSAMRKLQEADLGADAATIIKMLNDTQNVVRMKLEEEAGADFMGEAETYNPTPANGKKLIAHLTKAGKPVTKHNLLVAFNQLAATDATMLRKADVPPVAATVDDGLQDQPPPPVIVPSNQGRPEAPPAADVEKLTRDFAAMSLKDQQAYFSKLRRKA